MSRLMVGKRPSGKRAYKIRYRERDFHSLALCDCSEYTTCPKHQPHLYAVVAKHRQLFDV